MPQSDYMELPAIGACLECRSLFLVTLDTPNCILCGRLPTYTLPFAPARGGPVEPREEQPTPAEEGAHPLDKDKIQPFEVLLEGIDSYLSGISLTEDDLAGWFMRMGADPEAAATAVGRLVAVRELITQLRRAPEPAPTEAPELLSALAQAPYAHPSVGSPSPQEEGDRTTVPSP